VKMLRLDEVMKMTGLSRSSIYRYESSSTFPKRRRVGPNAVRWLDTDVEEWMQSRPAIDAPVNVSDGFGKPPAHGRDSAAAITRAFSVVSRKKY
jgi:prophage regulatory protein